MLSRLSARQLSLQAFEAMFLLTPRKAAELWDARMSALLPPTLLGRRRREAAASGHYCLMASTWISRRMSSEMNLAP